MWFIHHSHSIHIELRVSNDTRMELQQLRREHNTGWVSPAGQHGILPNEEFFLRRVGAGDRGLALRRLEQEQEQEGARVQVPAHHLVQGSASCQGS